MTPSSVINSVRVARLDEHEYGRVATYLRELRPKGRRSYAPYIGSVYELDDLAHTVAFQDELLLPEEDSGRPRVLLVISNAHPESIKNGMFHTAESGIAELPMIPRIYVPAQRALSPAEAGAATWLLAAQLVRAGITTLCDGTLIATHEAPTLEALDEVGVRVCMARGAPDQDFRHAALYTQYTERSSVTPRPGEAAADLRRTQAFLERYPARGPGLVRGAVNASSLLSFSETYFREGAALARAHGTTIQVHVGRDREEVELCLAVWGRRPVERLADLGVVDEHLVAVHAVLASGGEIDLLAQGGAALTYSPMECVYNLNAIPDVQRFRRAAVRVGLGCDNQGNDMPATMRAALLIQGAVFGIPRDEPDLLTADDALAMATIEAAQVLRWDDRIGSLEAGKAADLVVLDGGAPHLLATQDLVTEVSRFATRAEVTHVMVNGRWLLDAGRLTTVDLDRLQRDGEAGAARVRAVVGGRRYRPIR